MICARNKNVKMFWPCLTLMLAYHINYIWFDIIIMCKLWLSVILKFAQGNWWCRLLLTFYLFVFHYPKKHSQNEWTDLRKQQRALQHGNCTCIVINHGTKEGLYLDAYVPEVVTTIGYIVILLINSFNCILTVLIKYQVVSIEWKFHNYWYDTLV